MPKQCDPLLFILSPILIALTLAVLCNSQNTQKCKILSTTFPPESGAVCPASCAFCSNGTSECFECKAGFYLVDGQCYPCLLNCQKCSNIYTCDNCYTDYIFSSKLNACVWRDCLSDSCLQCNSVKNYSICGLCAQGFMLKGSLCVSCISECQKCSKNICESCLRGYFSQHPKCLSCMANCVSCRDNSSCSECTQGYRYNMSTKSCSQFQISSSSAPKSLAVWIAIGLLAAMALIMAICIAWWKWKKGDGTAQARESNQEMRLGRVDFEKIEACGEQLLGRWRSWDCVICLGVGSNSRTTCLHYFHLNCLLTWRELKKSCPSCHQTQVGIKTICSKCKLNMLTLKSDFKEVKDSMICPACQNNSRP